MTLTLTIRNAATLDNGMPTEFVLHRRGALVGRADTCDWSLPDPQRHISSRHCEIRFHDDGYWLSDTSTNGTFVNGSSDPVQGEHRIESGDVILIGDFEIAADLTGAEVAQDEPTPGAQESFGGWNSFADGPSPTTGGSAEDEWGEPQELPTAAKKWEPSLTDQAPAAGYEIAGPAARPPERRFEWGERRPVAQGVPSTDGWDPTHDASDMPDGASVWEEPKAAPDPSSGWSSAAADRPPPASPGDIWGQIAENNVVDWARGGFGSPIEPPPSDPLGLEEDNSINATPLRSPADTVETSEPTRAPAAAAPPRRATRSAAKQRAAPETSAPATSAPSAAAAANAERLLAEFLDAAGLSAENLKGPADQIVGRAGALLRRLIAGLVILVEARARAKSQMGAESTRLELRRQQSDQVCAFAGAGAGAAPESPRARLYGFEPGG